MFSRVSPKIKVLGWKNETATENELVMNVIQMIQLFFRQQLEQYAQDVIQVLRHSKASVSSNSGNSANFKGLCPYNTPSCSVKESALD